MAGTPSYQTTRLTAYEEVKHYNEVAQLTDEQVWELVAEIDKLRAECEEMRQKLIRERGYV